MNGLEQTPGDVIRGFVEEMAERDPAALAFRDEVLKAVADLEESAKSGSCVSSEEATEADAT